VELKSVGFTNEPNIPVPPITRANEKRADNNNEENKDKKMDELIKQELLAAGIIQPGATDDDVRSGVKSLCNERKDLRSKVTGLESKVTETETALANEKTAREAADTAKATALTALANERKERATLVVDAAITRGAVPTGEREAKIEALANEADEEKFSTALTALANESGKAMKTGSTVGNLGARDRSGKAGDLTIRQRTEALANEIANGGQVTDRIYEQAYARLKTQSPELFEPAAADKK
jgi:vacuolar-type H+-ATPase subunit I/STV1